MNFKSPCEIVEFKINSKISNNIRRHCAKRALSSDHSINSFIMVVYENFLAVL